jgi:hypothetical protein
MKRRKEQEIQERERETSNLTLPKIKMASITEESLANIL